LVNEPSSENAKLAENLIQDPKNTTKIETDKKEEFLCNKFEDDIKLKLSMLAHSNHGIDLCRLEETLDAVDGVGVEHGIISSMRGIYEKFHQEIGCYCEWGEDEREAREEKILDEEIKNKNEEEAKEHEIEAEPKETKTTSEINGTLKTTTSQNILFYDYESAENEMTEENMQNDSSTLKIFGLSLTMLLILLIAALGFVWLYRSYYLNKDPWTGKYKMSDIGNSGFVEIY